MTQPLTTETFTNEQLRDIAEGAMLTQLQDKIMARELLANREAQPVAWAVFSDNGNIRIWSTDRGITENVGVAVPLYTAPPVPVVNTEFTGATAVSDEAIDRIVVPLSLDGLDEEKHHCEWHLYHDRERIRKELREHFAAPPVPAVPDELVEEPDTWKTPDVVFGWNACRDAMLAQPVSQGCQLNSPEIPDGCHWTFDEHDSTWDSGCGEAWMLSDGGQIENGVKLCQSCGKPVLLAAAPEGGNDA